MFRDGNELLLHGVAVGISCRIALDQFQCAAAAVVVGIFVHCPSVAINAPKTRNLLALLEYCCKTTGTVAGRCLLISMGLGCRLCKLLILS